MSIDLSNNLVYTAGISKDNSINIATLELLVDSSSNIHRDGIVNIHKAIYQTNLCKLVKIEDVSCSREYNTILLNIGNKQQEYSKNDIVISSDTNIGFFINKEYLLEVLQDKVENGIYIRYDLTNGVMLTKTEYRDSKKNGKDQMFYPDGNIELEINYIDDIINGEVKEWYDNGNIKSIKNHINDAIDGECTQYYEDGTLWVKQYFKNNLKNGLSQVWHENGQLWAETHYIDGKRNGPFIEYYSDGQKAIELTYKNDVVNGAVKKWDASGVLVDSE